MDRNKEISDATKRMAKTLGAGFVQHKRLTPMTPVTELVELRAKASPELVNVKQARLAQLLRDGAAAQRPRARNFNETDFEADAAFIVAAMRAADTLTQQAREIEVLRDVVPTLSAIRAMAATSDWVNCDRHISGLCLDALTKIKALSTTVGGEAKP